MKLVIKHIDGRVVENDIESVSHIDGFTISDTCIVAFHKIGNDLLEYEIKYDSRNWWMRVRTSNSMHVGQILSWSIVE